MTNLSQKKDKRDRLWANLELDIQRRASLKQPGFRLKGPWKKYLHRQGEFKVYAVEGDWVRNNLSVIFGHGGHGLVHEFIPMDEIWVGTHHFQGCGCKNFSADLLMSEQYFASTLLHEITEFYEMQRGKKYWQAHNLALKAEIKAGFLKNPYKDVKVTQ